MRGRTTFALALSVTACQQTVVLDQRGDAGGGNDVGVPFCSGPPLAFELEAPEVIVALDRSASMGTRFGDSSILAATRDAIDTYATRYQKLIRFGYVEFPGSGTVCSPSPQAGCCASALSPPALNFAAFDLALHACEQSPTSCTPAGYQRPTASALTSCSLLFAQRSDLFRRYVLLVTNGRPDCGTNQNSACMEAQNTVNALANNGVNTVVVAPGPLDQNDMECLQGIAAFGGAHNAPYYHPAGNPAELAGELGDITRDMAKDACELDLTSRITDPDRVGFFWKETQIPRNRNDGWELTLNGFEIVLHGEWCERLVDNGPADFTLFTDCDPQR